MIQRTADTWRSLPLLTVRETVALVGRSEATVERYVLPGLDIVMIGRTRMIRTASLRKWLGEDVEAVREVEEMDWEAMRFARKVGGLR